MKKFCTSLREHVKNITKFEKKTFSHQDAKVCYICGKKNLRKAL